MDEIVLLLSCSFLGLVALWFLLVLVRIAFTVLVWFSGLCLRIARCPRDLVTWLFPGMLPAGLALPAGYLEVRESRPSVGVYGLSAAQAGGFAEPAAALYYTRLRRRARWVRALQAVLGGEDGVVARVLKGRWVPDQPGQARPDVQNYLLSSFETGARILGGGFISEAPVTQAAAEGGWVHRVPAVEPDRLYFVVEVGGSIELVFPALLGKLRMYALGRERDAALFGALRTRAMGWCKGVLGVAHHISDMAVASAVSLAMEPSTHERLSVARAQRAIQDATSLSLLSPSS